MAFFPVTKSTKRHDEAYSPKIMTALLLEQCSVNHHSILVFFLFFFDDDGVRGDLY